MRLITEFLTLLLSAGVASSALADATFPAAQWKERPDPIASPYAERGGTLRFAASQSPKSFNYYIDNNTYTALMFGMMYETLLGNDPLNYEFTPRLARRWSISDDRLSYTFHLDPAARWSDGEPVTAEDVQWTFDQIMDPKNPTGPFKVILGDFSSPEIIDKYTIRFKARINHWRNLNSLGSFEIMPKHAFKDQDFSKLDLSNPIVSGPYVIDRMKEQISTRLKRRADWWAVNHKSNLNTMNFDHIVFKYFVDNSNAFEAFKKGDVDVNAVYSARLWVKETTGEKFYKNWIIKQRVSNHQPIGFQGFALNIRSFPFDDLRVRKAIAHLVDRRTMNRTMMYNSYFLLRSYYEDLYKGRHPCPNPLFEYDIERAKELLKEAGFIMNPNTGILERDGQELAFEFLTRTASTDKFLVLVNNAFKEVGIKMKINRKDFSAWMRDMDAYNFQATWASWSASVFRDPENFWLSTESERPSGNNISGFKDARVDALIEKQKTVFSISERNNICREIDGILTESIPYVLLWTIASKRMLYWNKLGTPDTVLDKFSDERSIMRYWWYDQDSATELKAAMKSGESLPQKPDLLDFDTAFKQPQTDK